MSSGDESETVGVVESLGDILTESVSSTSRRYSPATWRVNSENVGALF